MKKGFTLAELLVVITIIAILSVMVFPYYHSARKQLALQRSASKLAQDIRRAQGMALGAEAEESGGEVPEGGYGIYFRKNPPPQTSYILFADKAQGSEPPNQKYDPGGGAGETIEEIFFEEGIKIKNLDNPHVNIIFKPPDPEVYLKDNDGQDLNSPTSIVISLIDDESKTKTIKVNKAGLIYVE